jgi:putative transposase
LQADLRDEGIRVSQRRIRRLMRQAGLVVRGPKRKRPKTTQSNPAHRKFANHLGRNFQATVPNRKWVAAITYIDTHQGWLYLAGIMDLCSRKLVGLTMDTHMESELVQRALRMALVQRQPEPGLLHHSDQGSQYTSGSYFLMLDDRRFTISMSRRGQCLDNAPIESFWGTLKAECADYRFESIAQAKAEIFGYIMGWYNRHRRHSTLDYLSPEQFERLHGWTD